MKLLAALTILMATALLPGTASAVTGGYQGEVREQVNRTVALSPGAQVTVRGINGGVTIETADVEVAEIDITITASDRETLTRRPLVIEEGGNFLTIKTEDQRDGRGFGRRSWVRHQVRLRLPRSINLAVSSVNGGLDVGAITGGVKISSINGRVKVDQAGSATEITSVNGGVTVALERLAETGLRVASINGGVEIRLGGSVNAEVEVRSVNGGINSEFPLTVVGEMKRGELRGTLGSGGAPIAITSVNGGVNLRRL